MSEVKKEEGSMAGEKKEKKEMTRLEALLL